MWNSLLGAQAAENPDGTVRAGTLLETARSLGTGEEQDLTAGFALLMTAAQELAPHLTVGPDNQASAAEGRSFYSIALAAFPHPQAVELVIDRSSPGALRGLESGFPEMHRQIMEHVQNYGWIPLRSRGAPMNPKQIAQRLQKVFLRWKPADIEKLATPADCTPEPGLSTDLLLRAQFLATPFLERVADALGCPPQDLRLCTFAEITAALEGSAELPKTEIEARRWGLPAPLTGQAVALGRAVGRVRIIGRAAEGHNLQFGDVVVTGLSSPDHGGAASIFPTRTDAAVDIHKAVAILIDDGGLLSHAAMISRENGIPCLVGSEHGTTTLMDGQYVEVDATKGDGTIYLF